MALTVTTTNRECKVSKITWSVNKPPLLWATLYHALFWPLSNPHPWQRVIKTRENNKKLDNKSCRLTSWYYVGTWCMMAYKCLSQYVACVEKGAKRRLDLGCCSTWNYSLTTIPYALQMILNFSNNPELLARIIFGYSLHNTNKLNVVYLYSQYPRSWLSGFITEVWFHVSSSRLCASCIIWNSDSSESWHRYSVSV